MRTGRFEVPPAKKKTPKKATTKRGHRKGTMTAEHKEALAAGRVEGRAVRAYLDALEQNRPKRGRKADPAKTKAELEVIRKALPETGGAKRLELIIRRVELESKLETKEAPDLSGLRKDFIAHAKSYGQRRGITYGIWREAGVSAADLKAAGIQRSKG